jgi:REP element-mobilizing transposase RayT
VHVTSRVAHPIRSRLERRRIYAALRRALRLSLARDNFRIVHLAVLPARIHLIVEADDKHALARGMQGFQVSAARWLNQAARRAGTVFLDRYRMQILRTRKAVRAAIGAIPLARQTAWPFTWLLRIELARSPARRWFHSRADEDAG